MSRISRTAVVPYSAAQMFALVADIGAYPEFLPWCRSSHILSADEDEVVARLQVEYGALNKSFTTRNRLQRDKMMELALVEGPFSHLHGFWRFQSLDEGSRISYDMEFTFGSALLGMVAGPVFTRLADGLVDAFCARARSLYGSG